jgi:hypothetical protein
MFTIEDLRLGRCAVINDGTLEQLREVLILAFPNDSSNISGGYTYYFPYINNTNNSWDCGRNTKLPTQSVKDFLKQIDTMENKELKRGDLVWVSDDNPDEMVEKRIFLANIEGSIYQFIVVSEGEEDDFNAGILFATNKYKYATKVEEPKEVIMTIQEIEKALGVTNIKIVK